MISIYLIILFFFIATIYSSVGFGGGSSYIALLLVSKTPLEHIPLLALVCNLIVVSGSGFHYIKSSYVNWKFLSPFVISSIPLAYFGGSLSIDIHILKLILGICLLLCSIKMIFNTKKNYQGDSFPPLIVSVSLGIILGFLSGVVGIGGGIFLSPILYNFRWGKPYEISAVCCLFIFFNSIAGLFGQLSKLSLFSIQENLILPYWPLALSVLIGGQIGVSTGITKLKPRWIEVTSAFLVLAVSIKILGES